MFGSHCAPRVLHHARLDHVQHVGVAVVVVADVLLIELRQRRLRPHPGAGDRPACASRATCTSRRPSTAVRIDRRPEHEDHVVEDRLRLGIVGAGSAGRRAAAASSAAPAISVACRPPSMCTNALPSRASCLRLVVGQPFGMREPPRDLAVVIDLRQVVFGRDQREVVRAALRASCPPRTIIIVSLAASTFWK